ncbi:MAG: poly(R)-hydroxyalkanoic acid synthase subunit PhaE, partial [Gammaproteobacteria bacterium]
ARVVNSFMAWKRQGRKLVDQLLGHFNLPTRREADTTHERVQTLLRDQRVLHAEIAALREELDALKVNRKRSPRKSRSRPTAVRKSPPKKKTAD